MPQLLHQIPYNDDVHAGNVDGQSPPYDIEHNNLNIKLN